MCKWLENNLTILFVFVILIVPIDDVHHYMNLIILANDPFPKN